MRLFRFTASAALCLGSLLVPVASATDPIDFSRDIAPILVEHCLSCHNPQQQKGGLDLTSRATLVSGGESGVTVDLDDPTASLLIEYVSGDEPEMPKSGDKLSVEQVALLTAWAGQKFPWPEDVVLNPDDARWWSLRPLQAPPLPALSDAEQAQAQNPIDAFLFAALRERGLTPVPPADRRTLIRRLKFDLLGLPPTPEEVEAFVNDADPQAYERLVDRFLESPHYGERWARHWLDVVHYGDTHGYDKDKLRTNAWPYRDYVIRSFNADKPYTRFVQEQVAGDVLFPDDPDGVVATGFIAAGPWDFISHVEVPESKIDGQVARSMDRDDMVRTVMETFNSVTIGCARCHDHKFDPFVMEDYYRLQAVFAAVDRAERPFDADPELHARRQELSERQRTLTAARSDLEQQVRTAAGSELEAIEKELAELQKQSGREARPEFGYHSQIVAAPETVKWVQVDLGETTAIDRVVYVGCHDNYNNIGAGFGFPVRYRIEASDDPEFRQGVTLLLDRTVADVPNPGVEPQVLDGLTVSARYVRVTATKLALRQNDYIFALAELQVFDKDGQNVAAGKPVAALDSIEAPVRWRKSNLVDGYYYGVDLAGEHAAQLAAVHERRRALMARVLSSDDQQRLTAVEAELTQVDRTLNALPKPNMVYAAATYFSPQGNFQPRNGEPREIRLLARGNVLSPEDVMPPGALQALDATVAPYEVSPDAPEGARRAALAEWLVQREHPLTWRSIVNRVWLYHFGRGICDSPNDLGRMGQTPTHPELLDWLAVWFRDNGQSFKSLHRLICTSAAYRRSSADNPACAEIDGDNRFYWRMNRRRLEAEAIRDAALFVSGKLDLTMYGPGFQDFVVEKPEHSPHYEYRLYDPEDPRGHRRAVYRFLVRSQPQPFMTTLDCADPSMQVEKRNETVTALQALALLNNKLMVALSKHFAERVRGVSDEPAEQIAAAFRLAVARPPTDDERAVLTDYVREHGLENGCRLLLNLNEFVFVD